MRKKLIVFVLGLFLLIASVSCDSYTEYSGRKTWVHNEAIFSIAGLKNMSVDYIKVLETDDYGRTLYYMFVNNMQIAAYNSEFIAVLVAQQLKDDTIYYYEDINCVLIEIEYPSTGDTLDEIVQDNQNKVDSLKATNDWNAEKDYSKCYSKPAKDFELDFSDVEDNIKQYAKETILDEIYGEDYRILYVPLDYKLNIYIMTVYIDVWPDKEVDYGYYDMYIVIYTAKSTFFDADYIRVENEFDYSSQLQDLKANNGWH